MTFFTWRQFVADVVCFALLILPLLASDTVGAARFLIFGVALVILSGFRGPGIVGASFLGSLIAVHALGLAKSFIGMEVGHWDIGQWFGGVYWHESAGHLQHNLAVMILPFATLGLMGVRAWEVVLVLSCSVIGFGLGVQIWGDLETIHAGASGVASGLLGAAILSLLRQRLAWGLLPVYLWTGVSLLLLLKWCLPRFAGSQSSWEGHLGGLVGGASAMGIILVIQACRRPRRPSPRPSGGGPAQTPFSSWAEEHGPRL